MLSVVREMFHISKTVFGLMFEPQVFLNAIFVEKDDFLFNLNIDTYSGKKTLAFDTRGKEAQKLRGICHIYRKV